jgi:AcrR family transcriptional regulator
LTSRTGATKGPASASQRGSGAAKRVSTERIVQEALAIVRSDGVSGLSMRKLAARIDSDVGLAYYYVRNKQELMTLVIDELFSQFSLAWAEEENWRDGLRGWAHAFYDLLLAYPGLAELLLSRPVPTTGHVLVQYDALIGCMRRGGLSQGDAALGYVTLHTIVSSRVWVDSVMAQGHPSRAAAAKANMREYRALLKSVDPDEVPHFVWLGETSARFKQDDHLDFGVGAVILALEARASRR